MPFPTIHAVVLLTYPLCLLPVFHQEIVSEMGQLGVLGPTIRGMQAGKGVA